MPPNPQSYNSISLEIKVANEKYRKQEITSVGIKNSKTYSMINSGFRVESHGWVNVLYMVINKPNLNKSEYKQN